MVVRLPILAAAHGAIGEVHATWKAEHLNQHCQRLKQWSDSRYYHNNILPAVIFSRHVLVH